MSKYSISLQLVREDDEGTETCVPGVNIELSATRVSKDDEFKQNMAQLIFKDVVGILQEKL